MTEEIIIKYISEFGIGASFGILIIVVSLWIFINLMAYLERKKECKKK